MCLGRTELPLGAVGRMQAALLGAELTGEVEAVYSSPLSRAVQTAQALRRPITVIDGLAEQDAGEWDGLTFDEIRVRYPELYARRAVERYLPMPGAEPDAEVLARFKLLRMAAMRSQSYPTRAPYACTWTALAQA